MTAVLGKIPARPDFVRHHRGEPAMLAFDAWLMRAHESLVGVGKLVAPVRFVFSHENTLLVGVLCPSVDAVGRTFPLAIAHAIARSDARISIIPFAFEPFFASAASLAAAAEHHEPEVLFAHADSLIGPTREELGAASAMCDRTRSDAGSPDLCERLFGPEVDGQVHYALNTFSFACEPGRRDSKRIDLVLDCPVAIDVDLYFWMELTARMVGTPAACFWVEDPLPRLLISPFSAPPPMLAYLVDPAPRAERLWPLRTTSAVARESAKRELAGAIDPALQRSIGELLDLTVQKGGRP